MIEQPAKNSIGILRNPLQNIIISYQEENLFNRATGIVEGKKLNT